MRFIIPIIFSLLVANLSAQPEQAAIQFCFKAYKTAIIEGRGGAAVELVDKNTLNYYARMLEMALYADSTSVQNAGMIDKMTIFTTRHKIAKDTLLTMNGHSFFAYAINSGMVGKNSVVALDLGDIEASQNYANAQIVSAGQPSPLYFEFNKEDEQWKIDITSIFPASTLQLNQMLAKNGIDENEYIFQMLQLITGKMVANEEIWQPL